MFESKEMAFTKGVGIVMDITLSKTQQNIAQEARRFLKKECPPEYVQEMFMDERGFNGRSLGKNVLKWIGWPCGFRKPMAAWEWSRSI